MIWFLFKYTSSFLTSCPFFFLSVPSVLSLHLKTLVFPLKFLSDRSITSSSRVLILLFCPFIFMLEWMCFRELLLFSHSVESDSFQPHGLQHTRLPCPPPPRASSKLRSIESVMLSKHLILCHPLLLPSIFPSIRAFPSELALHIRWTKYWSFSISPSQWILSIHFH